MQRLPSRTRAPIVHSSGGQSHITPGGVILAHLILSGVMRTLLGRATVGSR
jgi:hypothetical protein